MHLHCYCAYFGTGQRSLFLLLTERIAASGDENGSPTDEISIAHAQKVSNSHLATKYKFFEVSRKKKSNRELSEPNVTENTIKAEIKSAFQLSVVKLKLKQ